MKVLVHYDYAGVEPYGVWWVDPDTGHLQDLYRDPQGPYALRGRILVYAKTNPDMSWSDWFDQLTTRTPYFESWSVIDSQGDTPKQILESLTPAPDLV